MVATMNRYYCTAESMTQGYPDKLCDQIADAMLDAVLAQDPAARVDCQVAATTGLVLVAGEIASDAYVIVPEVVRHVTRDAGFVGAELGFDAHTCGVMVSLAFLGRDIAQGYHVTPDQVPKDTWERIVDAIGATDQVTVTGFACDETPELIPLPTALAHRLCRQLDLARREALIPFLGPDGRSQVTVEYTDGRPRRVDSVVITTQHAPLDHMERLEAMVLEQVVRAVIPGELLDERTQHFINPNGRLRFGGPFREPGLSGRQGNVDGYGGLVGGCGPAFVGRDPMRIERCAAYMARHVAKNVVAAGLAHRFRLEITYVPGVARPVAVTIDASGTETVPLARIQELIHREFDLRPASMVEHLRLRRPIYTATATYGAFGRMDIDAPWEETDHAERLRSEARWKTPHELLGIAFTESHGPLGTKSVADTPHERSLLCAEGPQHEGNSNGPGGTTAGPPHGRSPGPDAGSPVLPGARGEGPSGADLQDVDLTGRDLQGESLFGAGLEGTEIEDADPTDIQADPGQLLEAAEPEWFVRCPVCAGQGILTQVRYMEENGGYYTIPVWPWAAPGNGWEPGPTLSGGTTMADYWPCGHLSNEAHELLYGDWCALEDGDWLQAVAQELAGKFRLDFEHVRERLEDIGGYDVLSCLQQHFELVEIDTGDRWGSCWVLPFAEDPAEALKLAWEDLLRLVRQEECGPGTP